MDPAHPVKQVTDVAEMLRTARQMEEESAAEYNVWANQSAANNDAATKKIFEGLVDDEERHFDQFDVELDNMKKFGDNYLALQSIERAKSVLAGKPGEKE